MNSKLVFLDIDGTLTTPGSNIPPESAMEAIRAAQKAGHKVFLCSGRNYDMLKPLLGFGFDGAGAFPSGREERQRNKKETCRSMSLFRPTGQAAFCARRPSPHWPASFVSFLCFPIFIREKLWYNADMV